MNLREFFGSRHGGFPAVPEVKVDTVGGFVTSPATVVPQAKDIVAMHKMLVKYAEDALQHKNPARFLSRLHESVPLGGG